MKRLVMIVLPMLCPARKVTIISGRILRMLVIPILANVVEAADTPPPIPVVAREAKAIVPVPRDPNDQVVQGRTRLFNEQAQKGGFDVMFLGDSITHCWEPFNPNNGEVVWKERIAPFHAVNFGIGGENTETLLWRLENGNLKGALDPKVIVLMIGTNNAFRDKPDEIAAGIGAIVTRLHERLPKAKILLYGIFPRIHPGGEVAHKTSQEVNRIIAKYDGHWNIKYIDIGERFIKPDGTLIDGVSWDGLHLTNKGYGIWADSPRSRRGRRACRWTRRSNASMSSLWGNEKLPHDSCARSRNGLPCSIPSARTLRERLHRHRSHS